jgi:hypothetical protein
MQIVARLPPSLTGLFAPLHRVDTQNLNPPGVRRSAYRDSEDELAQTEKAAGRWPFLSHFANRLPVGWFSGRSIRSCAASS